MQEDVEQRSITLAINGSKFTGRLLKSAISKYLVHRKEKQREKAHSGEVIHHGRQTVKQLIGQNQGVNNIEIVGSDIRDFERIARRYGVDYAVKKVGGDKPKFLVFFKARDADALTAAFTEYADKKVRRQARPSVLKLLRAIKDKLAAVERAPVKNRSRERGL